MRGRVRIGGELAILLMKSVGDEVTLGWYCLRDVEKVYSTTVASARCAECECCYVGRSNER